MLTSENVQNKKWQQLVASENVKHFSKNNHMWEKKSHVFQICPFRVRLAFLWFFPVFSSLFPCVFQCFSMVFQYFHIFPIFSPSFPSLSEFPMFFPCFFHVFSMKSQRPQRFSNASGDSDPSGRSAAAALAAAAASSSGTGSCECLKAVAVCTLGGL